MPASTTRRPFASERHTDGKTAPEFDAHRSHGGSRPDRMELNSFSKRYDLYLQRKRSPHGRDNG